MWATHRNISKGNWKRFGSKCKRHSIWRNAPFSCSTTTVLFWNTRNDLLPNSTWLRQNSFTLTRFWNRCRVIKCLSPWKTPTSIRRNGSSARKRLNMRNTWRNWKRRIWRLTLCTKIPTTKLMGFWTICQSKTSKKDTRQLLLKRFSMS